jgi:hypothetical protein
MKYVFIYNATSGSLNAVLDSAHKFLSPDSYACSLCDLTHGYFGEKAAWTAFRKSVAHEFVFYHKDEFEKIYAASLDYPVILKANDDQTFMPVMSREELGKVADVETLIDILKQKLT